MTRMKDERGMVLVVAMSVLMIVSMLGLAILKTVNVQTSQTGYETRGEAAFNLAETALHTEIYQLQMAWPGSTAPHLTCNQLTPRQSPTSQQVGCEGSALTGLAATYAGPAYTGATWSVQVLDDINNTANHYLDTLAVTVTPSWDSNNDGRLWVRAQATVRGQTRIVVEQVVRQDTVLTLPDNTVTAGGLFTENNGNKVIIQARDSNSGLTGNVELRCNPPAGQTQPTQGAGNCTGWNANHGQLSPPDAYGSGYVDSGQTDQTLSPAELYALKQTALANGTYYGPGGQPGCPPEGTPGIVYVEDATSCPAYKGNGTWNSAAAPGVLVVNKGSLTFTGNETFYGVIYMVNAPALDPPVYPCPASNMSTVFTVDGNAQVFGAVFVDGCGAVATGESKTNVNFDSNALFALEAVETAVPAQNTFQEL
jgi:competence protein ComGC